ncbi:MAG: hypothetical protein QOJ94_2383 [Sphingomonadales bacterium]|jgi:hypothetical protein|nr:hypothetical protein [Sphingomonadales bacterium]
MPAATITGILKPGGVAASRGADPQWYLTLILLAWRDPTGRISRSKLFLQMPVEQGELDDWMKRLPVGAPLRIEVEPAAADQPPRRMKAFVAVVDDPELVRVAEEIANPPPIVDPALGEFRYDATCERYAAQCRWGACAVELSIATGENGAFGDALAVARALWAEPDRWTEDLRRRLISELLPLKNDVWLEEGEAPLSPDEFWHRAVLQGISVEDGGHFTFWFDDGDMFWRHAIEARGSLDEGVTEVMLAG